MKYKTKQKELIYSYFYKHPDFCLSAQELKSIFKGQKIGLTTIYRCLQSLEKEQVIHKYISEQKHCSTYGYNTERKHSHYHLRCSKCHTIIHLECTTLKELTKHIEAKHSFVINPLQTTIYGLCHHCTEK